MKNTDDKSYFRICWLVPVLFFLAFCASTPDITGKWNEVGKVATIEFPKDGTFKAVKI